MDEGGRIIISVSQLEGKMQFLIKNNGELIETEKIESISKLREASIEELSRKGKAKNGYGISNIIKRLRLYYYDNVDFYFSVESEFTVCHIGIPMEEVRDEKT